MRQIVTSTWFSPGATTGCIGIVVTYDTDTKEHNAYIGMGAGISQPDDETKIADWGSAFPMQAARILFKEKTGKDIT